MYQALRLFGFEPNQGHVDLSSILIGTSYAILATTTGLEPAYGSCYAAWSYRLSLFSLRDHIKTFSTVFTEDTVKLQRATALLPPPSKHDHCFRFLFSHSVRSELSGLSKIRTYNVYPKGPVLQTGAEPPSLQSTQIT